MAEQEHVFGRLEIELVKPYPDTKWGVMPGTLDGEIVVHALNPNGIAKDYLKPGDKILAIDGEEVQDEAHVVELLNAAHDMASPDEGANIVLIRPSLEEPTAPARLTQLEVHLVKPRPDTKWGVMPGILNQQIVVHALNPEGDAKDQLQIGDRIITVDGVVVNSEAQVVNLINEAHDLATADEGCEIVVVRPFPPPTQIRTQAGVAALANSRSLSDRAAKSRLSFRRKPKPKKTEPPPNAVAIDMSV